MGNGYSNIKTLEIRNLGREVNITINGKSYKVSDNVRADTTLNEYIREYAQLKGTKFMCLEGGCGACIVSVTSAHPATGKIHTQAVNSCLVPIFACHGWSVTTIEGLGSKKKGYNKITKRLAAANGTQCGYCSPGMVMNMHSLLESKPKITMKEVENSFGGNMCRCTGYRPILDAFKSLASDATIEIKTKLQDIEDLMCERDGLACLKEYCMDACHRLPVTMQNGLYFQLKGGNSWFRPADKKEAFEILDMVGDKSYRLIAGNTGHGVYRYEKEPEVYIDLNGIAEFHTIEVTADGILMGGNVSLTEGMEFFYKIANETPSKFEYCQTLADHLDLVASVPIRNIGTFAGNLFLKYTYHEFPSDIFLILEMVNAQLIIVDCSGMEKQIGLTEFLQTDMNKKIISKILLPALDSSAYVTHSFKVMPRAQNAHAYINAGFKFKLDHKTHKVLEKPTILYGGINPDFLHATKMEEYFTDKLLVNSTTLDGALAILEAELKPDHVLPDPGPEYRKGLAMCLFYKFVLSIAPNEVSEKFRSGGSILERPLSSGKQDFESDTSLWPLNKPIPKIEGLMQCSGEAEYVNDIPKIPGELWAQLVLCDRAKSVIAKIDPSEALKLEGVEAFYSAEDIPGRNNYFGPKYVLAEDELVFTEGRTNFAGEAVGIVVAESNALAIKAAKLVKIEYTDQIKPIVSPREIIENNISERITKGPINLDPVSQGKNVKYKISGRVDFGSQYHYTMEPLTCLTVPHENEYDVYVSAQWPSSIHEVVSECLKVPQSTVNVHVRRVGGGYGAKVSKINQTACAASLAAYHLQKPVRLVLKMESMMEWIGKRSPAYADYEAGVDENGLIQYLNLTVYEDGGCTANDSPLWFIVSHLSNCYDVSTWTIKTFLIKTDLPGNTWCRAPASSEGECIIESIMEHIANTVGKDSIEVRRSNMIKDNPHIVEVFNDLLKTSDYENRLKEVDNYNKMNRWKKKGLAAVPISYPISFFGLFHADVSIFGPDGTVSITHGGVEVGQGLNTKVVQVAAYILGIDTWKISIKPVNIHASPNNGCTGGSTGSEAVCYAVKKCCDELNSRLEPAKTKLGEKATWEEICYQAYLSSTDLKASCVHTPGNIKEYNVYAAGAVEVEVDILTGQYQTKRVDILEDAGQSISPEVDIGQVEGAFMMGMGYYTYEEIIHDINTGKLLTNRTWNYKPPGIKDIPVDFRVTLRKNAPNPVGVLRSKATGEPPLCLSCAALFALRIALESARKDSGIKQEVWFDIEMPYTSERIWAAALTKRELLKLL